MAYESEHSKFMRDWLQQHSQEQQVQQSGRALWWDRGNRDLDEQARIEAAKVPQKPYYYDAN
jgi:hypothetical protein